MRYASLNIIIQTVLRVTADLVNHPAVRKATTIYYYSLALQKKCTACGKEANMNTVYILSLHTDLICQFKFCTKQTPKISQHYGPYRCSKCVSQSVTITINVIPYNRYFVPYYCHKLMEVMKCYNPKFNNTTIVSREKNFSKIFLTNLCLFWCKYVTHTHTRTQKNKPTFCTQYVGMYLYMSNVFGSS